MEAAYKYIEQEVGYAWLRIATPGVWASNVVALGETRCGARPLRARPAKPARHGDDTTPGGNGSKRAGTRKVVSSGDRTAKPFAGHKYG